MNDMAQELTNQLAAGIAQAGDKLALDMILRGCFPSAGWGIAYRIVREGNVIRYELSPVPPQEQQT